MTCSRFVESKHKDLLDEIRTKREITDDLRKRLIAALDQFMQIFAPAAQRAA